MTYTVFIREDSTWMPKGWILRTIFAAIQAELDNGYWQELIDENLRYAMESTIGDFRPFTSEQFQILRRASVRAFERMLQETVSVDEEAKRFGLLFVFLQFLLSLNTDTRLGISKQQLTSIRLDEKHLWQNQWWICEAIISYIRIHQNQGISRSLIIKDGFLNLKT